MTIGNEFSPLVYLTHASRPTPNLSACIIITFIFWLYPPLHTHRAGLHICQGSSSGRNLYTVIVFSGSCSTKQSPPSFFYLHDCTFINVFTRLTAFRKKHKFFETISPHHRRLSLLWSNIIPPVICLTQVFLVYTYVCLSQKPKTLLFPGEINGGTVTRKGERKRESKREGERDRDRERERYRQTERVGDGERERGSLIKSRFDI